MAAWKYTALSLPASTATIAEPATNTSGASTMCAATSVQRPTRSPRWEPALARRLLPSQDDARQGSGNGQGMRPDGSATWSGDMVGKCLGQRDFIDKFVGNPHSHLVADVEIV